jgi:hypothetical protein
MLALVNRAHGRLELAEPASAFPTEKRRGGAPGDKEQPS